MKLEQQLKNARGKHYGKLVKKVFLKIANGLKADAEAIKATGKFTPRDVFNLSQKYNLSFKLTAEFLEDLEILSTGTYDCDLKRIRIKDFLKPIKQE